MTRPDPYEHVTAALRHGSTEEATAAFESLVEALAFQGWVDFRDTIYVGPYVDCLRRLGADPVARLATVTARCPEWLRKPLDRMVADSADAVAEFGWRLEQADDGPRYLSESSAARPPGHVTFSNPERDD